MPRREPEPSSGATAVLEKQGVTADRRAATPADTLRLGRPDQTPAQILLTGAPSRERFGHLIKLVDSTKLDPAIKDKVVTIGIAAATQSREVVDQARPGIDAQTNHPAIRTRVEDTGTLDYIANEPRTNATLHGRTDSLAEATDRRVRVETGARTVALEVADILNAQNGKGPKGAERVLIEHQAAALAEVVVQEALALEQATPTETPAAEHTVYFLDHITDEAPPAALLGVGDGEPSPYRRGVASKVNFSEDIREIGSEGVARRTKVLAGLPEADFKVTADKDS